MTLLTFIDHEKVFDKVEFSQNNYLSQEHYAVLRYDLSVPLFICLCVCKITQNVKYGF